MSTTFSSWNLTRVASGESRTLEGWKIKSATKTLVNQGRDFLELGFAGNDLLGNSPFDDAEILRLDRVESVDDAEDLFTATTVFLGRIVAELRGAYGANEGLTVIVAGPWWYLENLVYTQPANFAIDLSAAVVSDVEEYVMRALETSTILFAEDRLRSRVDSRFMIIEALNFAIGKGAPIQYGVIDAGISIPREELADVTCAEIVLRSLRWTPTQASWFDYTTDPPTLHIRERASKEVLELDLEDQEIDQVELNPRRDLIVSGVRINYWRRHQRYIMGPAPAYELIAIEVATLDSEEAGPDPTGIGALVMTMELYGSTIYQITEADPEADPPVPPTYGIDAQEDAPEGIAAALYASYSTLQFDGRISLVRQECDASAWISLAVQMLNGNPAWLARLMDIRQAADNLFSGRTELTIGPNNQLGPGDLLGLLRKGKTTPPPRGNVIIRDEPNPDPVIPSIPPIVTPHPGSNPHDPPSDDGPHFDLDPADFITLNVVRSGETLTDGASGLYPPGPSGWAPLGPDPAYTVVSTGGTTIGASIAKTGRTYATGGVTHWNRTAFAGGYFSTTTFNFGQFATGVAPGVIHDNVLSMWLIGTQTKSGADLVPVTTPIKIEISGGIGGVYTYRAVAEIGATWQGDDGISYQVSQASGSVLFTTLRVFTRPTP